MIEMTLSSRHRIRNSSPGGLRPSTLPLGHGGSPQYWLSHVDGEETFFVSFKPPRPGTEPRTLAWTATTTLGPPPPGVADSRPTFSRQRIVFGVRGPPFNLQGGGGAGLLFKEIISGGLINNLLQELFICLYIHVIKVAIFSALPG